MVECECLAACPFFNDKMERIPATAEMYKKNYCKGDFENCARYMVFKVLGKPAVPANLYPNQKQKAIEILSGAV
jgi:hypothetical protein